LRQARTAYAAGDRSGALKAIDAALELDPQYLAAQSLRGQVLARSDWPVPGSAENAEPAIRPSQISEGYARFEERARERRVQRRLEAARTAIAASRFEDAAAAVDELRELKPGLVDLPALSRAIADGPAPPSSSPSPTPSSKSRRLTFAVAIVGIVALAAWSLPRGPLRLPLPRILPTLSTVVELPAPAVAEAPEASVPEPVPVATSAEATNETPILDTETLPSSPVDVIQQPPRRPDPFVPLAPTNALTPVSAPTPVPPAPAPQPVTPPADAVASVSVPATVPATVTVNDDQLVREALQKYRWAYEELDAASAHDIWPGVDQAALARAFDGLASQALTFQDCAVEVEGPAATATCSGTMQYVPKVGSRVPRVEPRRWNFSLRKRGDGWQIENARAER
jgi:hypothetical protein